MYRLLLACLSLPLFTACAEPSTSEAPAPPGARGIAADEGTSLTDEAFRYEPIDARADAASPQTETDAIAQSLKATPEDLTATRRADELPKPNLTESATTSVSRSSQPAPAASSPRPAPAPAPPPAPTVTQPSAPAKPAPAAPAPPPALDHAEWNELLRTHVSATGRVDYQGFRNDRAKLDAYLSELAANRPARSAPRAEQLAYYINAYNAYTIQLILDNWPLKSIRDIGEPWDKPFVKLGDQTLTLNQLEHELIRPRFNEPRIHFALVCAAKSCPPLANRAYTAGNLESMLESRTRAFLRNERFNVTQEEVAVLSPLFDWYEEDFGDVREYVNGYLERPMREGVPIRFGEYDWGLNN